MKSTSRKSAFTLIELLVVISIILIASAIIFTGGTGGDGAALSTSQRIISGIAQGARGQAILKNANTRLIINNDPSELDKYRRFFGIVYYQSDDPSTTPDEEGWVAATQGTYLPEGIYFDAATSADESGGVWTTAANMTIDFPRITPQAETGGAHEYLYYGFKSNGTSVHSNAYLVIRAGTMIPDGSDNAELSASLDQEYLRSALIFRRAGTTTPVSDPGAIDLSSVNEIK